MTSKSLEIPYVDSAPSYLVGTVSSLLTHVISENEGIPNSHESQIFNTPWKYEWVKVPDYIDRLKEWIVCGPESYVVATCLLKRLEVLGAVPSLDQTTVHRIFFTCFMLAVKTTEDETLNNADFAKVGCIQLADLNAMEVYVLKTLKFACTVSSEEFSQCKRELIHLDLLFTKAKNLKSASSELIKLGGGIRGSTPVLVSSLTQQLSTVTPRRYLAASLPKFKDRRNSISDSTAYVAPDAQLIAKTSIPTILPSFWRRRMSLEVGKSVMQAAPATHKPAPATFFRQDST